MEEFDALVTGGSGFLWKYLLGEPLCARFRIGFFGRTRPEGNAWFRQIDLAAADFPGCGSPPVRSPVLLHFAAPTPAAEKGVDPGEALRIAGNAAALALECGAGHLVHASSGAVYGLDWPGRKSEDDPAMPGSEYGRAKLASERLLDARFTQEAAGRRAIHLRLFFPAPAAAALRRAVAEGDNERLFARVADDLLHDRAIRLEAAAFRMNPCPGPALVELLSRLIEGRQPPARILNVAGARTCTLEQAAVEIGRKLGRSPVLQHGNGPARSMVADIGRLRALVGDAVAVPLFD